MPADCRPKVLVVDDAPQNVKLLRAILRAADYQVVEAGSGPEALQKVRSERPQAVILDVRMPGMSGYEVCERLRADPQSARLPVIMVTALSMPEERIRGLEAGATDFITKPFNKRELLARLQGSLARAGGGGFAAVGLPLLLLDGLGRVVEAAPEAAALLGRTPEQLTGLDLAELAGERRGAAEQVGELRLRGPSGSVAAHLTPVPGGDGRPLVQVAVLERAEPMG